MAFFSCSEPKCYGEFDTKQAANWKWSTLIPLPRFPLRLPYLMRLVTNGRTVGQKVGQTDGRMDEPFDRDALTHPNNAAISVP